MRIFRLTRVESSLDGSVRTDSLRISPSSIDEGSYFTITSLRLIGAFTFLAFSQSWLTYGDLYFSLHAMTLKICLLICRKTYVADWLHNCMQLCVGCTDFVHVCVRLFAMYAALLRLYGLCVHLCMALRNVYAFAYVVRLVRTFVYGFCPLSSLCIRISILRVKRLVHKYTDFAH